MKRIRIRGTITRKIKAIINKKINYKTKSRVHSLKTCIKLKTIPVIQIKVKIANKTANKNPKR